MTGKIMEIATFKAKSGVSESDVQAALKGTMDFVRDCEGFIRRTTSVGEDGLWFDYVEWQCMADAQKAGVAFMKDPRNADFMNTIDPDSVTMRHNRKIE